MENGLAGSGGATSRTGELLAAMESEARRLDARVQEALLALGPSLPLTEIAQSTRALRQKLAEARDTLSVAPPSDSPASENPSSVTGHNVTAMRAVISKEESARRLSQELEKELGQRFANAIVEIDTAGALLQSDLAAVQSGLTRLRAELQAGLERLRWIIQDLRPPSLLAEMGLGPSITRYAQRFSAYSGLLVVADSFHTFHRRLPASVELAVFRIIQEALKNVYQHAHASRAILRVNSRPDGLVFVVEDDGQGFSAEAPAGGLGLIEMLERARAIGGQLRITSQAGVGTVVSLFLPNFRM